MLKVKNEREGDITLEEGAILGMLENGALSARNDESAFSLQRPHVSWVAGTLHFRLLKYAASRP